MHVIFLQIEDRQEIKFNLNEVHKPELIEQKGVDHRDLVPKLIMLLPSIFKFSFLLVVHLLIKFLSFCNCATSIVVLLVFFRFGELHSQILHIHSFLGDLVKLLVVSHPLNQNVTRHLDSLVQIEQELDEFMLLEGVLGVLL